MGAGLGRLGAVLVVVAAAVLVSPGVRAGAQEPDFRQFYPPFLCEGEVAIFDSLKHGQFDYCRQHLRYRPGTYDCLRIILPTCNVFPSVQPGLVFRGPAERLFAGHAERIVCPPGPPPPTCPSGFPAGPIPRP